MRLDFKICVNLTLRHRTECPEPQRRRKDTIRSSPLLRDPPRVVFIVIYQGNITFDRFMSGLSAAGLFNPLQLRLDRARHAF